jgi:chromosome partitioning protein
MGFNGGLITPLKIFWSTQMRIIAIANQKGGCAKTTTVVNLAACLAELQNKVLVIDLDPQANASHWLGANGPEDGAMLIFKSTESLDKVIGSCGVPGVDIIAASQDLAQIEKVLSGELAVETILKRRLKKMPVDAYDYVLIDTPPTLGLLTLNALAVAKELLVPVTTHVMTLSGVTQLINTIQDVQEILNPELDILGFIASRFDSRTRHSHDVLGSLVEQFGNQVFKTKIRENIRLAEAPSFSESIIEYDKNSYAADDYRALAKEIMQRINPNTASS